MGLGTRELPAEGSDKCARPLEGQGRLGNGMNAPTPTNRTRASHCNTISLLLPRDEIIQQDYEVKDKESGISFLEKSPFHRSGEPLTNDSLVFTILHITQYTGIPRTTIEGLRAIALLLEDGLKTATEDQMLIQRLSNSLSTSLSTQVIDNLSNMLSTHIIAAISPQVASILTASDTLKLNIDAITKYKSTIEENSKEDNTSASAAAIRAELAAEAVLSSISNVKDAIESLTHPSTALPGSPKTYSAEVQQNIPTLAPISAALIRASTRDRQILFDSVPGQTLFAPEVSPAKIASKMKQALAAIESDNMPATQIKAITCLRNGGLIIELTTSEAATWIRTPSNRLKIIKALGISTTIKE
ncbi:uncharacterized protein EDB93DRAFT_1245517 [Suillus bovinus]|uniref:uncharacterized protein n=1 Tax=Suillus bovinus TaxID=48563 RepID=UPI001B882305|nr:uncharacterized protein EDB93DRAFT_1245517 [Suillus bovinus]KAG2158961.1 hypothetical protein EDB93DRAFT_1245517 [Suillus bovinus]